MRAKSGTIHSKRRARTLKDAKGFRGARHRQYRMAKQSVVKAGVHAYNSRRQLKRQMRALWIVRINAAARLHGLSYSRLIHGLSEKGVALDRKALADIAFGDPLAFKTLCESAR
ncbi:MAG: 50S ribosomal protein L20 [Leptospirales bacterium]|nr:50S ribosomal protein L20 [Leptospirales bacterium]